jgi:hypothetical protein
MAFLRRLFGSGGNRQELTVVLLALLTVVIAFVTSVLLD